MRKPLKAFLATNIIASQFLFPSPVQAQNWESCLRDSVPTIACIEPLFARVLGIMLSLIGLGTFVMIMVGGFRYLLSSGDPQATEAAANTLKYAIGGLVGVFIVWFILVFIADFTGVDVLNFTATIQPRTSP